MEDIVAQLNQLAAEASIAEILRHLAQAFPQAVAFSTSLGEEDQAVTQHIADSGAEVRVFTLDTGRLFPETYETLNRTRSRYKMRIETYAPNTEALQQLLTEKGPVSFYESVENRTECCQIRKVEPLRRALQGAQIWITGLRGGQSEGRTGLPAFQYDPAFGLIKYNPLHDWSLEQVRAFNTEHRVPVSPLHAQGFVSIGCAPCTRAILPGEDIRAGRWWWEESKKECGLHAATVAPQQK